MSYINKNQALKKLHAKQQELENVAKTDLKSNHTNLNHTLNNEINPSSRLIPSITPIKKGVPLPSVNKPLSLDRKAVGSRHHKFTSLHQSMRNSPMDPNHTHRESIEKLKEQNDK